jgi:hypothetical protein
LHALSFFSVLRNTADFSDAVRKARTCDDAGSDEVERGSGKDASQRTICRSYGRMDIVGMHLDRRRWHAELATDAVDAIVIYTDASPVTGSELQGMIADVALKSGEVRRVIMPGSTLSYGHYGIVGKTIAFVWSAWLSFGPKPEHLRKFFFHIVAICTDFGCEMHTLEMPDVIDAFFFGSRGLRCAIAPNTSTTTVDSSLAHSGFLFGAIASATL